MRIIALLFTFAFALVSPAVHAQSLAGVGVVLMHGKGGQPGGYIGGLAAAMEAEGAVVVMPVMGWAGTRGVVASYDATYEEALAKIDDAVASLKSRGARKIVIAGQSLGANAAIAYVARRGGAQAVIALAPGHTPDRMFRPEVVEARQRAQQLIAAGQGGAREAYPDANQGQWAKVPATASAWFSYNNPDGAANMPKNAARLSVPFLYVIGTSDPLHEAGRGYIFARAKPNPKSRYVEIDAGHFDTPDKARAEVIAWLKAL